MQNVYFTPPQLAPLFGVNVSTIKRWADRGYLPSEKTSGGHRRISREHLEKFIKQNPKHSKNSYVLRRLINKDYCPNENCWKIYYKHLFKNENDKAGQLLEKFYLSGTPILDLLKIIITPTMRYIADQWSTNKITVYEEHRMSFNMRNHLIRLDQFIPEKKIKESRIAILACAPGEYHEMPLQLIAILFKINGWKTFILGVNINANNLIKAAKKIKPQLMVISKTYTKKESKAYWNKLGKFMDKNNICIATGGGAWEKDMSRNYIRDRKCAKYFPTIKLFSEYLANYKRK